MAVKLGRVRENGTVVESTGKRGLQRSHWHFGRGRVDFCVKKKRETLGHHKDKG